MRGGKRQFAKHSHHSTNFVKINLISEVRAVQECAKSPEIPRNENSDTKHGLWYSQECALRSFLRWKEPGRVLTDRVRQRVAAILERKISRRAAACGRAELLANEEHTGPALRCRPRAVGPAPTVWYFFLVCMYVFWIPAKIRQNPEKFRQDLAKI